MELSENIFNLDKDWDPHYLGLLFSQNFHDFSNLLKSNMCDQDLLHAVKTIERYNPMVENILLDDETLCEAVEDIGYR